MIDESRKLALYFGCWRVAGHYLHFPGGKNVNYFRSQADVPDFPKSWNLLMDAGLLKNGNHPDIYDGKVFWTCGGATDLWFAFFWWDNSVDHRGASNSGFYVRGFEFPEIHEAFRYAWEQFPGVVDRQRQPLVLQASPKTEGV